MAKRFVQNTVQKKPRGNHDPISFYLNTTNEHHSWLKPYSNWWISMVGSQKGERWHSSFSCWPDIDLSSDSPYCIFHYHCKCAWVVCGSFNAS